MREATEVLKALRPATVFVDPDELRKHLEELKRRFQETLRELPDK